MKVDSHSANSIARVPSVQDIEHEAESENGFNPETMTQTRVGVQTIESQVAKPRKIRQQKQLRDYLAISEEEQVK